MQKIVSIKISKIEYTGDSIGENIKIETEVSGKLFILNPTIKVGTTFDFNQEIAQLQIDNDISEIPISIRIRITEKDLLFNDIGEINESLHINTTILPKTFNFQVKVQEKNKIIGKSTAIFKLMLIIDFPSSNLQQYKFPKSGQDYNQYDKAIEEAVIYWNKEFLNQDNPPPIPLDPNLVKAMIYVESKMGYYEPSDKYKKKYPNYYHSYPDVTQLGDPRNGSLFILKNIKNSKTGKKITEYEIINGQEIKIEYSNANIDSPEQSIYWGVRWLFRKARENIENTDGTWTRKWIDWKDALHRYNVGDPKYIEKVYKVYQQGIGENKFKLWYLGVVIILILFGISSFFIDFKSGRAAVIDTSYKLAEYKDSAFILNRNLHDSVNCKLNKDSWLAEDILKNCTYNLGLNSSDLWSTKLVNGIYSWTPKNRDAEIIGYNYEKDGPYYVEYEKGEIGDLNNDGKNDAAVVLMINGGGNAIIRNILVLVQNNDGAMYQYASYIMKDREDVENIYINHGIISANVWVKSEDDPQCCASVYDTKRFKIIK